ncbi:carbohydrate-binding module family 18 protein [Piromyces sp. E2]|nr:carbohydrate-binding module family 18 protein [Piromyces sp. E2]|eukprot:OUM60584.1 carbohydrate-binding module family 18 protein [Piromyces sp. E2]
MRFNLLTKNILVALSVALAASETVKTPLESHSSCKQEKYLECRSEEDALREQKNKYEPGTKKYNEIEKKEELYSDVCGMVFDYNKPLQESDVYDIKEYFSCEKDGEDFMCYYSKWEQCNAVVELYCTDLSRACDKISNSNVRDERIHSTMMEWLECPIGDEECRKESTKKCKESAKNYLPSESKYCENYRAVCDMVMDYKPSLSYDNLFNLDGYLSCKKTDINCITKKEEICKEVYDICVSDDYPKAICKDIKKTCDKVTSMKKNATKTSTTKTKTTKTKTTKTNTTKSKTTSSKVPTSTVEGKCGERYGACGKGYCCSKWGYCGKDSAYCGSGCQSKFGICN